jgi:oligopeptidase B
MERTAATAEKLYREMKSRTLTDEETVPELIEGYYYYTRQAKGSDFHLYCRKKGSLEAPEQVRLS